MGLTRFFDINMPYGMCKGENNKWVVFNREHKFIGCSDESVLNEFHYNKKNDFFETEYTGLNEQMLKEVSDEVLYNNGEIYQIHFYIDKTNPLLDDERWNRYISKLKKLSKINRQ